MSKIYRNFQKPVAVLLASLAWAPGVLPAFAQTTADHTVTLQCQGRLTAGDASPAIGPDLGFSAVVPFGDGRYLAISVPDTDRVDHLFYDSEVQLGTITIGKNPAQEFTWTRATSLKGSVTGLMVNGSGDVVSLVVRAAKAGTTERPFTLLSTDTGASYTGACH